MNRRAATAATVCLVVGLLLVLPVAAAAAGAADGARPVAGLDPEPPPAPVTVNEFIPDDRNIGDCLGALERPGCGSEERGGWRQAAVFAAVVAGMGLVFWRVAAGVRRNRADPPPVDAA